MIELVVEDGSIVANANSYVSVDEIIEYASYRGVTLAAGSPINSEAVVVIAINAMDYLERLRNQYKGTRTDPKTQRLSWPRTGAVIDGETFPSDEIPQELKDAQCQLCVQISRGVNILPTTGGETAFITKEKVGPIETEYSEAVRLAAGALPSMPAVDALLEDLLTGSGYGLRTQRI